MMIDDSVELCTSVFDMFKGKAKVCLQSLEEGLGINMRHIAGPPSVCSDKPANRIASDAHPAPHPCLQYGSDRPSRRYLGTVQQTSPTVC